MTEENEIDVNMQMMLEQLKVEWERPGTFYRRMTVNVKDMEIMESVITDNIQANMDYLNKDKLSFENTLRYMKINYILLRIVKKIRKQKQAVSNDAMWLCIDLDKEEAKMYSKLMKENTYTGGR